MRVRILRDRLFSPDRRITIAYRAGMELTIRRAWGKTLVDAGDAVEIEPPGRGEAGADEY